MGNAIRNAVKHVVFAVRWLITLPITIYQRLISPLIPSRCIYSPTCSHYAKESIRRFGLLGIVLAMARVGRCVGGLYTGGDDPVPEQWRWSHLPEGYRRFWARKK